MYSTDGKERERRCEKGGTQIQFKHGHLLLVCHSPLRDEGQLCQTGLDCTCIRSEHVCYEVMIEISADYSFKTKFQTSLDNFTQH